jgi:hypothetical protein
MIKDLTKGVDSDSLYGLPSKTMKPMHFTARMIEPAGAGQARGRLASALCGRKSAEYPRRAPFQ